MPRAGEGSASGHRGKSEQTTYAPHAHKCEPIAHAHAIGPAYQFRHTSCFPTLAPITPQKGCNSPLLWPDCHTPVDNPIVLERVKTAVAPFSARPSRYHRQFAFVPGRALSVDLPHCEMACYPQFPHRLCTMLWSYPQGYGMPFATRMRGRIARLNQRSA